MKKICFVIPRTYYLFNSETFEKKVIPGGAQTQSFYLSTTLAKDKNFDVRFLVADFGQANFEIIKNVKLHKSFSHSDNIFKRIRKLFKTLKEINADTYIFRSADAGVAAAVFYVKTILKKKALYMLASDVEISKKMQKKYSGILTAFFMQYVYKNANIITSQTQQQKKLFEKNRNRKSEALIKNIFPKKENLNIDFKNKKTVLWVGRLTEVKKPDLFLKLSEKYPETKFVMIAPPAVGKAEYGKNFKDKAKKIKNLQFIDYVKPSEIFDFYKKAKILVITSELEGFPNILAEASQAECSILSFSVNPDNIINKYKFGFCAENDIEKFYSFFEKLISDDNLRKTFGKNAAKYILENHNSDKITEELKKLL